MPDQDLISTHLADGDEVFFEINSDDLWLQIVFQLYDMDELLIYGVAEFIIDKRETLEDMEKKL